MPKPPVITDPKAMYAACEAARRQGKRVAFVPTMGALHDGHLSLVTAAKAHGEFRVVSIFVNPKQFGPTEDLDKYPRTLDADREKLAGLADLVFAPSAREMYPDGFVTEVKVPEGISEGFCGAKRPGHFDGVAVVVTKLFNIVGSCTALFGRKDYQQLKVIAQLTRDLNLPVTIVGAPTVREADGLALSSRNAYLSPEARVRGLSISQGLRAAHRHFDAGTRDLDALVSAVRTPVEAAADRIDYVAAADPDTLRPIPRGADAPERLFIAVAAFFGTTRLIDNTVLGEDGPP